MGNLDLSHENGARMPPDDEQPWDGTERRSGRERRRKDRWTLDGEDVTINDRRRGRQDASPPQSPVAPGWKR